MKKCPYCGKENPDNVTVCKQCFAGLPVNEPEKPKKAKKTNEKE